MMKKTLKFFSRYNQTLVFEYDRLEELINDYTAEINYLINFLKYVDEFVTPEQLYRYYIRDYFKEQYGYTDALNLVEFLHFGIVDFEMLKDDIYTNFA